MNKLQKNYIKSFDHAVKLDSEIWNDIKTFFTENYSEHSIIFTLEDDTTKKFTDFDSARDFIIKADNDVHKIRLFAKRDQEVIKIDYVNGIWTKQAAFSGEANNSSTNYEKVGTFFYQIEKKSKAGKRKGYSYIGFMTVLYFTLQIIFKHFGVEINKLIYGFFIPLMVVFAIMLAYDEIAWGKKKVHFLIDSDKQKQYNKRNKRNGIITILAMLFLIAVFALTIIFFGIQ